MGLILSGRRRSCRETERGLKWFDEPFSGCADCIWLLLSCEGGSCIGAPKVLEFLDSLKNFEKLGVPKGAGTESAEGFDLARMYRLLSAFGDPLSCYPVIHVAGTKGKGSTAAFIGNILRAEGYSVGSYTSPHIMSIHERIVAGKSEDPITPDAFQKLFEDNRKILEEAIAAEQGALTYFEVLSVLAFQYFAQVNVDIAVVEAGLGGARDATNVISAAGLAVAVITNIGKEHSVALGGSLESIALAKSGIIKQGRPVVLGGPLDLHIEEIICEVAASKSSKVIRAFGEGMHHRIGGVTLEDSGAFQSCDLSIDLLFPGGSLRSWKLDKKSLQLRMLGPHQLNNALTAICTILCIRDQGWRIKEDAIWSGLERTFTLGRFQVMPKAESIRLGCDLSTLVLDGALVIAMASDKDHHGFCQELLQGSAPKVVVVTESMVAGGKYRSTAASVLVDCWCQAARTKKLEVLHALTKDDVKGSKPDSVITITDSESISLRQKILEEKYAMASHLI
ncbi:hypothetical protein GOP47_0010146 [Adiantum capillus-veneris]|uniref:Mur ligase central domain-containing protein n=1 Tax=Adiantum capillus-veneris TaxID=13818 RepID=A0A9D4ZIF5_ADICA|nr:hypothetical protein GOP47_0010146 [Adiantum capillus-veneris]